MTQNSKYQFSIVTNNVPSKLYITVETFRPTYIYFIGEDVYKRNTVYFSRGKEIKGKETLEFLMPLSPQTLKVHIFTRDNYPFIKHGQHLTKQIIQPFWMDADLVDYWEFIFWFAENAGHLPLGKIQSPNGEDYILYMESIDGVTPARVNRVTGVKKAAASMMRKYTVPMRVFIMGHEMCHHILPTKIEETADDCSIKYYLKFGFPETEANYAMTKIFGDSSNRAHLINRSIVEYDFAIRRRMQASNYMFM